ncbi:hypothetical protein HWA77_24580 [Photobacterium damselae subsp. damselae]|uniref:Uncharacterized protein n=1 Tax=Photobacterium damselae subsp. damselae TaxID=85581 RepID=A0A850R056_PHODD|nr:hypothetical protein [Photobacterium damselae subsp. damselae]
MLQQIYYVFTLTYIDLHSLITLGHEESRNFSPIFYNLGLTRPTSFFAEPSNASAVLTFLSFSYISILNQVNKVSLLGFIVASMTLSSAAVLISGLSLLVLVLFDKTFFKNIYIKIFSFFLFVSSLSYVVLLTVDRIFGNTEYDMISSRTNIFRYLYEQDWINYFFGNGILILKNPIIYSGIEIYNYTFRDSGFFVNLFFSTGIVGVVFFIFWSKLKIKKMSLLIIFLIILNSKYDYLQPVFWMLIFCVSISSYKIKGYK